MYSGYKILGLITARGGSKGIPKKNIVHLGEKPLIAWTIEEAKKSIFLDRIVLSSDDKEIIEVSKMFKCEVPFVRPKELAKDTSSSIDVVLHAIKNITEDYNYLVILQPTSPFRSYKDIDNCIKMCIDNSVSSAVSVVPTQAVNYSFSISSNNTLLPVINIGEIKRRQDLEVYYKINGAVYVIDVKKFLKNLKLINDDTIPYIMLKENSIDIDDYFDLKFAEFLLSNKYLGNIQ
ncbi:acylneuraminate cytidylyltransferase family protein [Fluviispira vulneris]|uniref:acylneuraminate cytidylyltransferase family protein n=1 Tax=Fluviispira vulneris TaxID=2763012 RepID=UPI00164459C0|nr:acylneuraminate cytidylyltransferase family protein [Fluviispira vulneris]